MTGRGKEPAEDHAVYVISVAAELAGVHPQTLRIYERKGLLRPKRTTGKARRYSARDISRLQVIQDLTQRQGVNLAGVRMIMDMQNELEELRRRTARLEAELRRARSGRATPLGPSSAAVGIVPLRTLVSFSWLPKDRRP